MTEKEIFLNVLKRIWKNQKNMKKFKSKKYMEIFI